MFSIICIDVVESRSKILLCNKGSSQGFVFGHNTKIGCLNWVIKGKDSVVNVKGTDEIVGLRDDKMLLDNFVTVELSNFTEYLSGHSTPSSSCDTVTYHKST